MSSKQTSIHVLVPASTYPIDREALLRELPVILNCVLSLILQEFDIATPFRPADWPSLAAYWPRRLTA